MNPGLKLFKNFKKTIYLDAFITYVNILKSSKIYSVYTNVISTIGLKILFRNQYKLIQKNKKLRNIHDGERCFILGNGPSLDNLDFSLLSSEYVFTVNESMRHPDFHKLKSNYHVFVDNAAFETVRFKSDKIPEDWKGIDRTIHLKNMELLPEKGCNNLFVPAFAEPDFRKSQLDKKMNIYYLADNSTPIENSWPNIDLTKVISAGVNVIHYAIMCACYMGFKEIYLIGVEATMTRHCKGYNDENDEKTTAAYTFKDPVYHEGLKSLIKMFYGYYYLNEYCRRKNIKLINLSEVTIIESIPRDKLENIINKN